jgi:hypothetical protein
MHMCFRQCAVFDHGGVPTGVALISQGSAIRVCDESLPRSRTVFRTAYRGDGNSGHLSNCEGANCVARDAYASLIGLYEVWGLVRPAREKVVRTSGHTPRTMSFLLRSIGLQIATNGSSGVEWQIGRQIACSARLPMKQARRL